MGWLGGLYWGRIELIGLPLCYQFVCWMFAVIGKSLLSLLRTLSIEWVYVYRMNLTKKPWGGTSSCSQPPPPPPS